ncbi:ATP-sensitive inward rectifier potassium channel 10 [Gloeocapsopsis crepidinum LEGE 06123]|uniref:ATP-sensitive inward rectifier potassium channel 10 n=1 Tax=Gloeocapsopsis crepidinum LEGE 06123 TaxID=588587 RepID=A0ABR9UNI4_9CHRO|nr:ion channel [Gloeocapsopsis crepidinum]MBE9189575.1 ATP-sensitive inward rectifier potassium channel 10 [Gloeocapsopsis crepidinum LEGE 06123]
MQKRRSSRVVQIVKKDGRLNIVGVGKWYSFWRDPYHLLLTVPWTGFLAIVALGYILGNAFFALAYLVEENSIANARPGNFFDAFFFSIQTMASIGYGAMYPQTLYANILVTIESLLGLIGLAMGTGLAFARLSQPTARVIFSRVAVITSYNGVPTLMFRTANKRGNQILEAELRVRLAKDEVNAEGHFMRRVYDLQLIRSQNPSFALSWTAMHPIDKFSPLHGSTLETLVQEESSIIITLMGIDETVSQTIYARYIYVAGDILWNMRFVDIILRSSNGDRYLDYSRFHDVIPS